MQRSHTLPAALLVILTALTGCASNNPVNSRLDSSGLTVVTLDNVVVLSRSTPHLTTAARDYAYLGPVEINRMGKLQHYIWLGMATTVDRKLARETDTKAVTLALLLDGTPMSLPLTNWDTELLDFPPYKTGVPVYESLGAPVSLDQISRIAQTNSIEIYVINDEGTSAGYQQWEDGQWLQWTAFSGRHAAAPVTDPDAIPEQALGANSEKLEE